MKYNQGFINTLVVILIAAVSFVSLGFYANNVIEKKVEKAEQDILGGTNASTTALSDIIGTLRTNVNGSLLRLDSKLTDSTSTDPGHKHTTSTISGNWDGVSGTVAIAKGGTGITTAPSVNKVLIGTSSTAYALTNAIPDCVQATSSKLLFTSTSQQWSCGTDSVFNTTSTGSGLMLRSSSSALIWDGVAAHKNSSSTQLMTNAAGVGTVLIFATTTIPANFLAKSGGMRITAIVHSGGTQGVVFSAKYGGQEIVSTTIASNTRGLVQVFVMSAQSTSSQTSLYTHIGNGNLAVVSGETDTTVNSSVGQTLTMALNTIDTQTTNPSYIRFWGIEPF